MKRVRHEQCVRRQYQRILVPVFSTELSPGQVNWEVTAMEHERAVTQMRSHLARAGQELQSAQRFLDLVAGDKTDLALARAIANAKTSINDAMDTIQQSLNERGGS